MVMQHNVDTAPQPMFLTLDLLVIITLNHFNYHVAAAVMRDALQMKGLAPDKKVFVPEVFSSTNGYASNVQFNK